MKQMIMRYLWATIGLIVLLGVVKSFSLYAQEWQEPPLRVRTEIHPSKVLLRWIPTDVKTWEQLNQYGVRLERLTIHRSGTSIEPPQSITLADTLRPQQSNELKQLVEKYPIGGVIAQAIWGKDFEVGIAEENQLLKAMALNEAATQRFLFSLYAADLCFPVAKAVGWGYLDSTIVSGEKYLYRITPLVPNKLYKPTLFLVDPSEHSMFPAPIALTVNFEGNVAKLSWDFNSLAAIYPNYIVERSDDSIHFVPISDQPITRLGETEGVWTPISYIDSVAFNRTYYYRVAGLTPFGTRGEYSPVVQGNSYQPLTYTPLFTNVETTPNGGAVFEWEISNEAEPLIAGFDILNSPDNNQYTVVANNIPPTTRTYKLAQLSERIYYKIAAKAKRGNATESFPILVQLIDSIPPQTPTGLRATVDSTGRVNIEWEANTDTDLLGYRLFRGENADEELRPMNDVAIRENQYTDSVSLYSLNANVYYAVAALDKRYNLSALSSPIAISRPNKIPPIAPVITAVRQEDNGCRIHWLVSPSAKLQAMELYRKESGTDSLQLVVRIEDTTLREYQDKNGTASPFVDYCLRAQGENNLFSDMSAPYRVQTRPARSKQRKTHLRLSSHDEGVLIEWKTEVNDIIAVQLYKEDAAGQLFLLYENLPLEGTLLDKNTRQGHNTYLLIVKSREQQTETVKKSIQL